MNQYRNLQKLEFVVTTACTGKCRHCSQGDHEPCGASVSPEQGAALVWKVHEKYPLQTVMTFGGEPLLCPDTVCAVHRAAATAGIPHRQLITNGCVTADPERMQHLADRLAAAGVNDVLLSVDAFHQETLPPSIVRAFAECLRQANLPTRLQPAWLVSPDDDNPYNRKTKELLREFNGFAVSEGNVIFPEGNARTFLSEYFVNGAPPNPYIEDPDDLRCLSVTPADIQTFLDQFSKE